MPLIQFNNPARDSLKVSPYSTQILQDIMSQVGLKHILITSTARTAADQARIMYENIDRHGVSHQKKLYGTYGDKIIDEYSKQKALGKSKPQIIQNMTALINSIGPRKVSRHAGDPKKLNVIDIAPSSIGIAYKQKFEKAVKSDTRISNFLLPPKDPAYHIEIPQP